LIIGIGIGIGTIVEPSEFDPASDPDSDPEESQPPRLGSGADQ